MGLFLLNVLFGVQII